MMPTLVAEAQVMLQCHT